MRSGKNGSRSLSLIVTDDVKRKGGRDAIP